MAVFGKSLFFFFLLFVSLSDSLSTVSISETSNQTLVCALDMKLHLRCSSKGIQIPVNPNSTFSGLVGGNGFLCALQTSLKYTSSVMFCWRFSNNSTNILSKKIYQGPALDELRAGNTHICGVLREGTSDLQCWQWHRFNSTSMSGNNYLTIAVGDDFVCGIRKKDRRISCSKSGTMDLSTIPSRNYSLIAAGFRHACAITTDNGLECWGDTLRNKPLGKFTALALGYNRGCALRFGGTAVCWGSRNFTLPQSLQETQFISLEAKRNVFCGVGTINYVLYCWGDGRLNHILFAGARVLPGPCRSQCQYGSLPGLVSSCAPGFMICNIKMTNNNPIPPLPSPPHHFTKKSIVWDTRHVAFLVVGCVGSFSSLLVAVFFLFRYCKSKGSQVHDSGPIDMNPPVATAVLDKRLSTLASMGNSYQLEEFLFEDLDQATQNFCQDYKIGSGSFGSVYHATLSDGRQVAIKRAETSYPYPYPHPLAAQRQVYNDNAFLNELQSLSRLNHRNLVRLIGFCEEYNELLLVYEYMKGGTLHDHLHKLDSSPLMSWVARIQVALDAAKGIEYLHEYAVPSVIHRDIKSSNILLDDPTWVAKVSDFGLSLIGPRDGETHLSLVAAGTFGYMDPEYYRLQQLTPKSDVYSFGVVLLEILSGKKAIHTNQDGARTNIVDYGVPYVLQDEIHQILDSRVPPPTPYEIEAVTYIGHLASDCVNNVGRDRPSMTHIVNSLEKALVACLPPLPLSV